MSLQCIADTMSQEKQCLHYVQNSKAFGTSLGISRRNNLGCSCMDTGKNEGFLVICPGEEHARNKEIDLVTKKGSV